MGLDLDFSDGQTPIDEDEKDGLLISTISTKADLNEFEQQNIEDALQWIIGRRFKASDVFSEKFICDLHRRMYKDVWAWAGVFRKSDKNIGIDKYQIPVELKKLCDDALYWHENQSLPAEEIAFRFKHRLVSIHCFSNGNGRHSRLIADIIIEKIYGGEPFTWGAGNLYKTGDLRSSYLQAVKAADQEDYSRLLLFARS